MNEIDLIVRLAKEMDVFKLMIDVGAHRGGACLPFLKDGWQVYAFEPDRHNRRHLEQVAVSQPRLVVDPRAISNLSRKDVPFYTSKVSDGISGLSRFHESHVETEKVETVTLRDAINTFSIDRVGFLKVDIEGYDLIALRGVPWERMKPSIIMCEFEDRKTIPLGYSFQDIARYLQGLGYDLLVSEWYPVVEYGRQHMWRRFGRFPTVLEDANGWGNILAFREKIDWSLVCNVMSKVLRPPEIVTEMDVLRKQVAYMTNSLSWRVTIPLRKALKIWKRMKRSASW